MNELDIPARMPIMSENDAIMPAVGACSAETDFGA